MPRKTEQPQQEHITQIHPGQELFPYMMQMISQAGQTQGIPVAVVVENNNRLLEHILNQNERLSALLYRLVDPQVESEARQKDAEQGLTNFIRAKMVETLTQDPQKEIQAGMLERLKMFNEGCCKDEKVEPKSETDPI